MFEENAVFPPTMDVYEPIEDLPKSITTIQQLIRDACALRLHGRIDLLEEALVLYRTAETELLRCDVDYYATETFHPWQELAKCKLGKGLVNASLMEFDKAEESLLQALSLLSSLEGQGKGHDSLNSCQMTQKVVDHLVSKVYIPASEASETSRGWLWKAWHMLSWGVTLLTAGVEPLSTFESSTDPARDPVGDEEVSALCNLFVRGDFFRRYPAYPECVQVDLERLFDLLAQVLIRLDMHNLSIQLYQRLVEEIDRIEIDAVRLPHFYRIRVACIRRVLEYGEKCLADNATDDTPGYYHAFLIEHWLDFAMEQLRKLDECRVVIEFWGDLFRLRGDTDSQSIALCLYAACFYSYGVDMSLVTKQVVDKIQAIVRHDEVSEYCYEI